MTTDAAVLVAIGQPLQVEQLEIPALKPGQVLVDVAYSGLCRSQLLEVRGDRGPDRYLPHVRGHEGSGIVSDVGPGVRKVKPGDHVVLSWIRGQGADVPSTVYGSAAGPVNSGAVCTLMRRTVTCESRLTRIADEMPLREAALLGCAVPTGIGAFERIADLRQGAHVAVFGAGGVGLSAVLAAAASGAESIVAIDVSDSKLARARLMGATFTINAAQEDPVKALLAHTGGKGVDCAIEAVGRRATMEAAFDAVRADGGLCVIAGNLPAGERITLDPFDLIKGKRIVGTWGGGVQPDAAIPDFVDRYLSGRLPLEQLIAQELGLDAVNEALDLFDRDVPGRALIRMEPRA